MNERKIIKEGNIQERKGEEHFLKTRKVKNEGRRSIYEGGRTAKCHGPLFYSRPLDKNEMAIEHCPDNLGFMRFHDIRCEDGQRSRGEVEDKDICTYTQNEMGQVRVNE